MFRVACALVDLSDDIRQGNILARFLQKTSSRLTNKCGNSETVAYGKTVLPSSDQY